MRRITIPTGLLALSLGVLAFAAPASAVTSAQLEQAGWNCIAPIPFADELHCARPGGLASLLGGEAPAVDMLVFDSSGQELLGTEHNVRGDVFRGQRCPTDPPTYEYTHLLPIFGIDYWACPRVLGRRSAGAGYCRRPTASSASAFSRNSSQRMTRPL